MNELNLLRPDYRGRRRVSLKEKRAQHRADGGLQRYRLARMRQDVKGGFTRWRKGEVVKVGTYVCKGVYVIEKVKPGFPFLALMSQCAGVPKEVLDFRI